MALTKEAQEKYGIIFKTSKLGRKFVITEHDFKNLCDDYPSRSHASRSIGINKQTLIQWQVDFGFGWEKISTPVKNRPSGIYGKLKWQELKDQQAIVEARYKNYTGPIYAIACLHSVFVDFDRLIEFLEREKEGLSKGVLLIVGDIFDFYNLSLFRKEYGDVNVKREIEVVKGLLAVIKTYCTRIILVPGNHDSRVDKRLSEQVSPEVRASLSVNEEALSHYCKRKQMKQTDIDNVLLLAKGSIITYLAEVAGAGEMKLWHCRIGDMIFCHPEKGVGTPLQTAIRAYMHFSIRQQDAGGVIVFHTHKVSQAIHRKWFIAEGGCMARTMDYMAQPNLGTGASDLPYIGYFKGQMKDGKLDKTRAVVHCLGECR